MNEDKLHVRVAEREWENYRKNHQEKCYCVKAQNARKAIIFLIERNILYVKRESTFGRTQIHIHGTSKDIEKASKAFVNISKNCEGELLYGRDFREARQNQDFSNIFKFFAGVLGMIIFIYFAGKQ